MIRVVIVGDIRLYREGLVRILGEYAHLRVVATAARPAEALATTLAEEPDVVLLDQAMPEGMDVVREIHRRCSAVRVVALTVSELESDIVACAEAGVAGYVTREASTVELVRTIEAVGRGELLCSPRVAGVLLRRVSALAWQPPATDGLTRREREVLEQIERGFSNKKIARALGIELPTVKNHVHNILEKLQVDSRGEAAALARRLSV